MNYRLTELKVLLFLLLLSAVSCQRPMYDEEDDEDGVSQTNLPLKISLGWLNPLKTLTWENFVTPVNNTNLKY
jgi:hypothetical protein